MATSPDASLRDKPYALRPRPAFSWRDMAIVTQANLSILRVEECRRANVAPDRHDIHTPPPGVVRTLRHQLITRNELDALDYERLAIRCRQVWGEFSGLCWLFREADPNSPPDFHDADLSGVRCATELAVKVEEVRASLWRLRFEQQLRISNGFRLRGDFHELRLRAGKIPVSVYGEPCHRAPLRHVLLYACEVAGVMAALRWAMDDRWNWEQEGITDVGLE